MKYNMMFRGLGMVLQGILKKEIADSAVRKDVQAAYREIVLRAKAVDPSGPLLGAYGLAAFFIAMNRCDGRTPEENCRILEEGLRKSKIYGIFMGSADSYFSEKKMAFRRKWSAKTHEEAYQKQFPNDWVVDVLEKTDEYQFGFDYTQCGVCKLCREEGCPELAKYLCRLDYMTTEMMGVGLRRTQTLAEGSDKCDFRFLKQK